MVGWMRLACEEQRAAAAAAEHSALAVSTRRRRHLGSAVIARPVVRLQWHSPQSGVIGRGIVAPVDDRQLFADWLASWCEMDAVPRSFVWGGFTLALKIGPS